MIDIMAQCPDDVSYKLQLDALKASGYIFTSAFCRVTTDGEQDQGGWLRLCVNIPPATPNKILTAPLVEYRYSEELSGWTADGVTVSTLAKGLHDDLSKQGVPQ